MTHEPKYFSKKKKKKTIIYLISGILIIAGIGTIAYWAWPKNKSVESKEQSNFKQEIQKLQSQLNSVKSKLDNLPNNTNKTQLENKLNNLESQVNNLSSQDKEKPTTTTIKKLEQEIEELKCKIKENDKPNDKDNPPEPNPQPNDNNKGWTYTSKKINDNTLKYQITLGGTQLSFRDFIAFSKNKKTAFFKAFQGALRDANSKFPAYFWECPPISEKTLDKLFEFVVVKSEGLNNATQNWTSFGNHISNNYQKWACSFPGLSGDNILVIPIPKPGLDLDFKNISQFTKNAPEEQQQDLWQEVAKKLEEELKKGNAPRWLSTHGSGVPYLHVRIDEKPKYYSHEEYKKWE